VVLKQVIDNAMPVEENFDGSMELLYEGALLAVLVVWWFLRDWRATLVAAAALPLSVMPAFLGIYLFGYTLNTVTLLSLALVVGVLVDDAIVEIENIARHLRMGKTPMEAAMEAADEIGMAVIATTFALVAVFLPTAFMSGIPGLFFKQFGWTAVIAVLASLVVARLLTPMMAAYLLKPIAHAEEKDSWLMVRYLRVMRWCLKHRGITALAAAAFFVGSISLVGMLPTGFVPAADRAQTQINLAGRNVRHRRAGAPGRDGCTRRQIGVQLHRRRLQRRRLRPRRGGRGTQRRAHHHHRAPHRPQGIDGRYRRPYSQPSRHDPGRPLQGRPPG
jgi:multidrug efflux pump subunit AcrB